MKRLWAFFAAIVIILSLTTGGTLAYHTKEIRVSNLVTTGSLNIIIHEKTDTGINFPEDGIVVMPGEVISKIVTVENSGTVDAYLRVKLMESVNDPNLSAEECLGMDINTSDWTYRNGYYYYNTPLVAGKVTTPLFTKVFIDGAAVDNRYLGKVLSLDISADAVQSGHNGTSVWDAIGWPTM